MDNHTAETRFAICSQRWAAARGFRTYKTDPSVKRPHTTTPKTFTADHANFSLTSEDYESYCVLTEISRRHRYALRMRRPIRAIRHLTRRNHHLAA